MKKTAVDWLVEKLAQKGDYGLGFYIENKDEIIQAKEMEKMYYTEFEVLQLLLKLQQTESYDNLYDWFQENKKQTFNTNEK